MVVFYIKRNLYSNYYGRIKKYIWIIADDEYTKDNDDGDDYVPYKDSKRQNFASQPKRKRGRPRKIRDPDEVKRKRGRIFKCPHCIKSFTRRHRVTIHIKLRHGFECSICNLK